MRKHLAYLHDTAALPLPGSVPLRYSDAEYVGGDVNLSLVCHKGGADATLACALHNGVDATPRHSSPMNSQGMSKLPTSESLIMSDHEIAGRDRKDPIYWLVATLSVARIAQCWPMGSNCAFSAIAVIVFTATTRAAGKSGGCFTVQSREMIDVLPDDVLMEILAFYANTPKHNHARVPMVAKHGVCIARPYDLSALELDGFPALPVAMTLHGKSNRGPGCECGLRHGVLYRRNLHLENGVFCIRFTVYAS